MRRGIEEATKCKNEYNNIIVIMIYKEIDDCVSVLFVSSFYTK